MTNAKKTSNLVTELYEFEGLSALITFRGDGWINMTKAVKAAPGKQLNDFWLNGNTGEYLVALYIALKGKPGNFQEWSPKTQLLHSRKALVETKRGGRKGESGTWCHPKLAVFFARWLDVRFAVWCDLMIDNILKGNLQVEVAVPTLEAISKFTGIPGNIIRQVRMSRSLSTASSDTSQGRSW